MSSAAPAAATPSLAVELASLEQHRAAFCAEQANAFAQRGERHMLHTDDSFMHGTMYKGPKQTPSATWKSQQKPRKDHDASDWLTATEYQDVPAVLDNKVKQLAALMRLSKHTCIYSGAGISAQVVGQAALSGQNKVGWTGAGTNAAPTPTHRALGALGRAGWVHGWVQQNHDGLPQKSGFPQEKICEVHGSWFDPSNPVVKYSGSLKTAEAEWMESEAQNADLVVVMGTSLGGLNADRVAIECAERAARGASLGAVIINLQQTDQDGKMSLNLFGKSDDVMARLLKELGVPMAASARGGPTASRTAGGNAEAVLVPYDASGARLPPGSNAPRMWLDLRSGSKVKLSAQHNCEGARQPATKHVSVGDGVVMGREDASCSFKLCIEGAPMRLGIWWLEAASRGGPAQLPIVNMKPLFEDSAPGGPAVVKEPNRVAGRGAARSRTVVPTAASRGGTRAR